MSKPLFSAAVLGAALALAAPGAFAQTNPVGQGAAKVAKTAASVTSFVRNVHTANQKEIDLATLAQQKTGNADVKSFAQTMLDDHKRMDNDLQTLAQQVNVTLPSTQASSIATAHNRLSKLNGAAFDKAYANMMVTDHKSAVSLVQRATNSADPGVKAFAQAAVPVLQRHLQLAQDLVKKLGGS